MIKDIEQKILDILDNEKEITQTELRKRLGISRSYLSEILSDMEIKRYIEKEKISERTVIIKINKEKYLKIGLLKSTEYAAAVLAANEMEEYITKIYLYDNALQEMEDFIKGNLDIVFVPIITGFIFHMMDERIVLLSSCARGGSGILYSVKKGPIGSTMLSTMDFQAKLRKNEFEPIVYYESPESMITSLKNNQVNAIMIWEPFISLLKNEYNVDMNEKEYCCGIISFKNSLSKKYFDFITHFKKKTEDLANGKRWDEAAKYMSKLLNMDENIIKESFRSYIFEWKIEVADIERIIKNFGIETSSVKIKNFIY
ncbi:MAG: MarR family transcriptional regulator [Thermoplasmata archaeon]